MEKHTKGPWDIGYADEMGTYIQAKDGYVAIIHYWSRPQAEVEANARLVAAAPLMLSVLERIADEETGTWASDIALAAIGKATQP